MTDVFSNNIRSGDLLTAETFQNIATFLKGSSVAGGSVSAHGISVPSEFARNPRTVRFLAEEDIENYSIIELTEQVEDISGVDNQVPTFKAKPATGDAGTLFYTESSFADKNESGMAYSIGGEPILIRSTATEDGSPEEGKIVANAGGAFRYLGESDVSELKWFLPVQGGGVSEPKSSKVRLVQPKELFPACEYKTLQDVYDCELQYSDEGGIDDENWTSIVEFDIVGGRVQINHVMDAWDLHPHKYWRLALKGFSKPADPNDPFADQGFYTYGRLWEALFWVSRRVEKKWGNYTLTANVEDDWKINTGDPVAVDFTLTPSIDKGELLFLNRSGRWVNRGSFTSNATVHLSAMDVADTARTSFQFRVIEITEDDNKNEIQKEIISIIVPKPSYTLSPDDAEIAMLPAPMPDIDLEPIEQEDFARDFSGEAILSEKDFVEDFELEARTMYFDSKPVPRKTGTYRYWNLTFDQPETITKFLLDLDQHLEHFIICPGGRDAFKQDIKFIYSFDLYAEQWTATTFPELQKPMYNMDAKVIELVDKTHQLIVLSGQVVDGFSNIIQGYNFEKDYIQNVVDLGAGSLNFAGRPALVGDPMLRNGFVVNTPNGEWDFLRSLIVVGGSERSCFIRGSTSAIDSVLFSVHGATLTLGCPYETQTLNISLSNTGNTGLPFGFFDYKTTINTSAGTVGTRLQNMGTYTRHQNLPVRGILRRRPQGNTSQPSNSNPVVDFLLIGGFNPVGREEYNKKIVSGIFYSPTASTANGANYSMLIQNPHFYSVNNEYSFLYYPDSPYVLGDCCAEYVYEDDENGNVVRDEIICFGGRANETDTAFAYENLAVLEFEASPSNKAQWNSQKYPPMPHPRWSAASVLIKDLVRRGEAEPCNRIFIIGGRNREGFVAEVDVFNLRHNEWETEENGYTPWKRLDQGELENYTATGSGGGATIIVAGGGGDGIQSLKAGDGIAITGNSKNPTISANLEEIVDRIVQSNEFKEEIAARIQSDSTFRNAIATVIMNNSSFQNIIANHLLSDDDFKQSIIDAISNNQAIIGAITVAISSNPTFLDNVTQTILGNQAFVDLVIQSVISNATLLSNIVNQLIGSNQFISTVLNQLVSNQSFVGAVVELMLGNANFMSTVVQQVTTSQSFINSVKTTILGDATFKTEILENILSNTDFRHDIINALIQSNTLIQNIANTVIASSAFITSIANEILNDQTVMNQIVNDVVNNASLINNIVQNIVSNPTLLTNITNEIINNEILVGDIINQVINHTMLHNQIIEQVLVSQTFISAVTNQIINNETIINNITQEIVTSQNLFQYITNNVLENNTFINNVTEQIVNHETIVNHITNEIISSETLVQNITEQIFVSKTVMTVLTGAVKVIAPDGSTIATNNEGTLTLQTATNSAFGIIKGQSNDSPTTWHLISATNGLLSINRQQLEAMFDTKIKNAINAIRIRAADGCLVGWNDNGDLILPFYQVENEPNDPREKTLYLVNEANAATP